MVPGLQRKALYASIAFIWLSSVGITIPYSLRLQLVEGACWMTNEAFLDSKAYVLFIGIAFLFIWYIPYIIIIVAYILTARALKANSLKHDNSRAVELRNKQNAKIVKMFVIVVIIFLVLTMPYGIFYFYDSYMIVYASNDIDFSLHFTLNYVLFILSSANGCVNLVIYAKMHRDINGYLRGIIHWIMSITCQICRQVSRNASAQSSTWSVSTSKTDQSII